MDDNTTRDLSVAVRAASRLRLDDLSALGATWPPVLLVERKRECDDQEKPAEDPPQEERVAFALSDHRRDEADEGGEDEELVRGHVSSSRFVSVVFPLLR